MNSLGLFALLMVGATCFGVLNERLLKLPMTIGILLISMVISMMVMLINPLIPGYDLQHIPRSLLGQVNLPETFLEGALSFLLFAGAMQVNLGLLLARGKAVAALAIFGTVLAVALLAVAAWFVFPLLGMQVPFSWCVVLGAILAPTDPVSVVGMLRRLGLPDSLQAVFAGESLFNDGVGVVIFGTVIGVATGEAQSVAMTDFVVRFLIEAVGGGLLGGVSGWVALKIIRGVKDMQIDLLASLALATGTYSLASALHMSGPIAVVVAGMWLATDAGKRAIPEHSRQELVTFWGLIDEILNALLFLLIGFELLEITPHLPTLVATLLIIPLSVVVRGLSVFLSTMPVHLRKGERGKALGVLTWGGLRGGISVALALGLPPGGLRETLLPVCYGVVVFTIIVQGLTMEKVVNRLYPKSTS
ncbi:cation:proton antiporter [Gluconobacter japonicus]|uniref:Sodium:proton antiporter n=1 Tax=Gluconobacter japonicus TaxID=376620 RepID=A0ABQ5WH42_GLUJA|nr:sodium:proton antiporter [Gluconobacter japonicus]KXV25640.1 sodium:proton antiporter [Gluconobacter japonicus]GBR26186.1 Na+/H+ antiporter [Gluconobacter japonicus NBRC 3271]GLQ59262.1 sodium:proton antiporter [Gluconobacter japonicus]